MARLVIYQISDVHWNETRLDNDSPVSKQKMGRLSHFQKQVLNVEQALAMSPDEGDVRVLVLNGDMVFGGLWAKGKRRKVAPQEPKDSTPQAMEEEDYQLMRLLNSEICEGLIAFPEPLREGRPASGRRFFHHVVVVPGNHDIVRQEPGETATNAARYEGFKKWTESLEALLDGEQTILSPFTANGPVRHVEIQGLKRKDERNKVALWAVNSTGICGHIEVADKELSDLKHRVIKVLEKREKGERSEEEQQLLDECRGKVERLKVLGVLREFMAHHRGGEAQEIEKLILDLEKLPVKLPVHDPGFVEDSDLSECSARLGSSAGSPQDLLRIAVVHHNSLPLLHDDDLKYKFWNAYVFNDFLIRNQFRIAYHGHQHVGAISAYMRPHIRRDEADDEAAGRQDRVRSYLPTTLLSVGAPAFDFDGGGRMTHQGFTISSVTFEDDHDICAIKVRQVRWMPTMHTFANYTDNYDLAVSHLNDRGDENQDRPLIMPAVNRLLYSDAPVNGLVRALDKPEFSSRHSENLRRKLARFREVNAIYAMSVFSPGRWANNKLMHVMAPYACRALARAAHNAGRQNLQGSYYNPLLFKFSNPLVTAIDAAKRNALGLRTGERIAQIEQRAAAGGGRQRHQVSSQALDFFRRRLYHHRRQAGAKARPPTAVSIWGDSAVMTPDEMGTLAAENTPSIVIERLGRRPFYTYSERQEQQRAYNQRLCEFPRIVSWGAEELTYPSALDVIEFHEVHRMPLFWLPKDRIVAFSQGQEVRRHNLGYVCILPLLDAHGQPADHAEAICHEENGMRLDNPDSEFFSRAWKGAAEITFPNADLTAADLEGYTLKQTSHPMHEFLFLLARRDIMFVADVWAYVNAAEPSETSRKMEEIHAFLEGGAAAS